MPLSAPDLRSLSSVRDTSNRTPPGSASVPRPAARWRTRVLVPGAVILATAAVLGYAARHSFQTRVAVWVAAVIPSAGSNSPIAEASLDSPTATPSDSNQTEPGAVLVQAPGWIEPSPYAVGVPALTDGVVREVLVLEGDVVTVGQVVARLIDDDVKIQARAAHAAVDERLADVERARSAIATAEAQVRVEQAAAEELRDEIASKRELVSGGGVGSGPFRRMEIRLGGLEAKVAAARRAAEEATAVLRQAESAVAAAQVGVDEANLRLARTVIVSPVGGVVLSRLIEPGSRVSAGMKGPEASGSVGTVLRLYDPTRLQVRVDVPIADAAKVGVGTPCSIVSEALPDTTFRGSVLRVVHEANIQRNTVQFKLSIENPSSVLKPEMLTRVKLHASASRRTETTQAGEIPAERDTILLVPTSSLSAVSENKATVWIVDVVSGSPVARRREITTASSSIEGYTVARSGLQLTDRVILEPPSTLRDNAPLDVLGERTTTQATNP